MWPRTRNAVPLFHRRWGSKPRLPDLIQSTTQPIVGGHQAGNIETLGHSKQSVQFEGQKPQGP